MRLRSCLFATVLSLLFLSAPAHGDVRPRKPTSRTYDTHSYYTLELSPSASPQLASSIAQSIGVEVVEPLGELAGHWLVRKEGQTPSHNSPVRSTEDPVIRRWSHLHRSRSTKSSLRSLTPLTTRQRAKRGSLSHTPLLERGPYNPHTVYGRDDTELLFAQNELRLGDPMLDQQWHLINTQMSDVELNVTGLWARGVTGEGVKVVVVDDGLDYTSQDLADNFYPEGSYDFNDHTDLPLPRLSDDQHGTRCAGEIAAVPNDVCGVGVSYNVKIAGVRILSGAISDADEAAALNYAYQLNDIYSCSWGPPDDGQSMEAPEGVILKAFVNGVQQGRDGKGSVYVFAAGNGGAVDDQCNFDGYTNSIFTMTIGAVDRKGLHPYYSEQCAAMLVVAPSSGSGDYIHTTDVGEKKCAHTHGGTSAAAPLAAGVMALALQVRPDLTWRDVQHLAVRTSAVFNPDDPDWETTAAGRKFSYKYGYGRLDGGALVEAAERWSLVKPQAWFDSPAVYLPTTSPADLASDMEVRYHSERPRQDESGIDDSVSPEEPTDGLPPDGDNQSLPAPTGSFITEDGIVSTYEVSQGMLDDSNFERLEHVTVRVWIEHQRRGDIEVELLSPNGIKSVLARARRSDNDVNGYAGWKFMSVKHWDENPVGTWTITVKDMRNPDKIGRFIAWSLQLWGESVDASLAKLWSPAEYGETDEEETGSDPTAVVSQKPKPTDHLPGDHGEAAGENDQPGLGGTPAAASPTGSTDEDITVPAGDVDNGYFPGIVSLSGRSTWLAGAGMITVLAGAGIGAFFYYRARRKSRHLFGLANNGEGARGGYAPVSEDVPMGLLERGRRKLGRAGSAAAGGTKDLYDAFGDGPSDESEDEAGALDQQAGLRYHDDFLGDDDEGRAEPPAYRDEQENPGMKGDASAPRDDEEGAIVGVGSNSGSSGSWQDAAEDVARV